MSLFPTEGACCPFVFSSGAHSAEDAVLFDETLLQLIKSAAELYYISTTPCSSLSAIKSPPSLTDSRGSCNAQRTESSTPVFASISMHCSQARFLLLFVSEELAQSI